MFMRTRTRSVALLAVAVLLFAGACNRGNDAEEADVDVTDAPERTPSTEAIADFQLVGRIDEAFRGQEPDIDISDVETDPDATASPAASPVGGTPNVGGIIRIEVEDASDDLTEACGIDQDDVVELFWTPATFFEPDDVLDDIEDEIEDRTAGILGKVYRSAEAAADEDDDNFFAEESPDATDDAAATTASPDAVAPSTDCILVAEQIGFTNTTALPTPRAAVRRTAAPTPVRTRTPSPRPTSTPKDTDTPPPATSAPATSPSPTST